MGEEAGAMSFKCMVRYARTGPAQTTQHGLDIGWSATCDREFAIVVQIKSDILRWLTYTCNAKHQTGMMMFVYSMSISPQTALSTSTRRRAPHMVPALNIHPREIQTQSSDNKDTGSYETLYEVDSSSSDVVIYWTMTGTHFVPDRQ